MLQDVIQRGSFHFSSFSLTAFGKPSSQVVFCTTGEAFDTVYTLGCVLAPEAQDEILYSPAHLIGGKQVGAHDGSIVAVRLLSSSCFHLE